MSRPVFDMDIFVEYKNVLSEQDIRKMALSAVVLYELTARLINPKGKTLRLGEKPK